MRRIVVAALLAALVVTLAPAAAEARHRPTLYCSPSGDLCQSTRKVDGERRLRITLAARYFRRYELCVTAPDDTRACKEFRIRKHGPVFGSSIRWKRHFPRKGPGAYDVRWRSLPGRTRVGRVLGFHIPA
jgi:hypothetical protein